VNHTVFPKPLKYIQESGWSFYRFLTFESENAIQTFQLKDHFCCIVSFYFSDICWKIWFYTMKKIVVKNGTKVFLNVKFSAIILSMCVFQGCFLFKYVWIDFASRFRNKMLQQMKQSMKKSPIFKRENKR